MTPTLHAAVATQEDLLPLQRRTTAVQTAPLELVRQPASRSSPEKPCRNRHDGQPLSERLSSIRAAYAGLPEPVRINKRGVAACILGITEGELIAAHAGAAPSADGALRAWRLRPQWRRIADALPVLGVARTIIGNRWCRLQISGTANGVFPGRRVGESKPLASRTQVKDAGTHVWDWSHGFAIEESDHAGGSRHSLQFFDPCGVSVVEVVVVDSLRVHGFRNIIKRFGTSELAPCLSVGQGRRPRAHKLDPVIDAGAFRTAWSSMRDVDDLVRLRSCSRLSIAGACHLAGPEFARELSKCSVHRLLGAVVDSGVGIAVHVYGRAGYQSHRCVFNSVGVEDGLVHAEGPQHGLSLQEDGIDHVWLVKLPSSNGPRYSVVLLDELAEPVAALSGSALTRIMQPW